MVEERPRSFELSWNWECLDNPVRSLSYFFAGSLLLIMAATVSFSRTYLSKHYLSDVLAGAFLGIILAMASRSFV